MNEYAAKCTDNPKNLPVKYEKYPPNEGAFGGWREETLQPCTVVDRYGDLSKTSHYASPFGTPSDARSLLPGTNENKVDIFMVSKPIKVDASVIAPWGSSHGGEEFSIDFSCRLKS